MPLTCYATTAPLESVWAFGWLVNRLLSQRPTLFVVLGTWIVGLPLFIGLAAALISMLLGVGPGGFMDELLANATAILLGALHLLLAARVTHKFLRNPRRSSFGSQ